MDIWMQNGERLEDNIDCLVSIGTGVPSLKPFTGSLKSLGLTLKDIAVETEETNVRFKRAWPHLFASGRGVRFNADGLDDVGLEEVKSINYIIAATKRYVSQPDVVVDMGKAAKCLAEHECAFQYA